jgi:predicted metallopeptidase
MTLAVKRLIRDVAGRVAELSHVKASRILVVAGEARGTSRATIRPGNVGPARGGAGRRFIRVRGRQVLYVITLRPLWFAASTPEERVATILHELYHTSARFDGTLHRGRRHARLPRTSFDRTVRTLLGRYLTRAPEEILAPFTTEGLVKVRMFLRVPSGKRKGATPRLDVDEHLFYGFMPLMAKRELEPRPAPRPPRRRARLAALPRPAGPPGHDEEEGG